MPQYVIEREIAGAGDLTSDDLKGISQKSCGILKDMGTGIESVSYTHLTLPTNREV